MQGRFYKPTRLMLPCQASSMSTVASRARGEHARNWSVGKLKMEIQARQLPNMPSSLSHACRLSRGHPLFSITFLSSCMLDSCPSFPLQALAPSLSPAQSSPSVHLDPFDLRTSTASPLHSLLPSLPACRPWKRSLRPCDWSLQAHSRSMRVLPSSAPLR